MKLRPELEAARDHLHQLQAELDALPYWKLGSFFHSDLLESLGAQMAYVRRLLILLGDPLPVPASPKRSVVPDEVLTPPGVAKLAGVNPSCVYKWIERGLLPAERRGGTLLIPLAAAQRFLEAREAKSA